MSSVKILKKLIMLLTTFALAIVCFGCGSFENAEEEILTEQGIAYENNITVGFSQLGSESIWREAHSQSIISALSQENGFSLEFNNARQKQENQIKAIRGFISQRVDYIAFSPVTEQGWDTVLAEAREVNIPVIVVDRKIKTKDDTLYTTWVGTDAVEEGKKAGEWLEKYVEEKLSWKKEINIVVLMGTMGSSAQLGRSQGFNEIYSRHKNWKIIDQQSADFTTAKGKEVMSDYINKHDNIDVIISQNDDMTFGVIEALDEAGISYGEGKRIAIVSFDAVNHALKLVQEGKINVDIECNPDQGEYIADIIKKLDNGEAVNKQNTVDEQIFTKENVDEFIDSRAY